MKVLLYALAFIVLGILAPALLTAIAGPWPFAGILATWSAIALLSLPVLWRVMRKKRLADPG
jgi:membrane protease YdiL (CAAX protease family)